MDKPKFTPIGIVQAGALWSLAGLLAWALTQHLMPLRVASNWLDDLRIAYFSAPEPQHSDIVVLTITEDTLAELPFRSPIDRAYLAEKIDVLAKKGARLVALDVILDQPTIEIDDRKLIESINAFPGPFVVAAGDQQTNLTDRQIIAQDKLLAGIPVGLAVIPKTDGVVRYSFAGRESGAKYTPSFVNTIAKELGETPPTQSRRLAFRPPGIDQSTPFKIFPLQFLNQLPDEWLADKIILIGADLPNQDRHRTPFSLREGNAGGIPGVVVHAHALAQIIDGRPYPAASVLTVSLVVGAMTVLGFLLPLLNLNMAIKVSYGVLFIIGLWIFGAIAYTNTGVLIPLVSPSLGFLIGVSFASAYGRRHEREAKRFMRRAFRRYVSPSVIDNLVAHPETLVLGGEKREMSFIFSDIAGFTTLSEGLPPQELVSLLQDYFDGMAKIAMSFDGTIERFLGDSVLVFFGAPADQIDHAQRAVGCALEWDAYCEEFRRDQLQSNPHFGVTRIGVHTGNAVVGNVGSRDRFEYTAHGDTVNTAARLESANKHFGTRVCISDAAAGQCSGVTLRPVGDVIFKGKEEPLAVLSTCQNLPAEAIKEYVTAFDCLRQNSPGCIDSFCKLAEEYPEDGLIAFHLGRLQRGDRGSTIRMEQK